MASSNQRLDALLRNQSGIATRKQLDASGVTWSTVRANLRGRRWQRLNDSVICTHNGPLSPQQARWAIWLSAAAPAALCSLTATEMWGLRGFEMPTVQVLVRRGARVLPVPGVRCAVHESRRFTAADVCHGRAPAVTTLERSVIDAAVWSPRPTTAARIAVAAVQQHLTSPSRLFDELEAAGRVRHRRALAAFLADLAGGAEALSEVEFLRWCRRHGFPRPSTQVRLDGLGKRRYLDAVFVQRGGQRVLVEVDGGIHLTLATRWNDTAKDNDAVLAGLITLRFPSVALYTDDPAAVQQLRRALGLVSGEPRDSAA